MRIVKTNPYRKSVKRMIQIDMPMPENCDECRFNTEYAFCKAMPDNFCGNTDDRKRPEWCPLKEQEAVEPLAKEDDSYECICGAIVGWDELDASGIVQIRCNYCPFCGKPISWKGR